MNSNDDEWKVIERWPGKAPSFVASCDSFEEACVLADLRRNACPRSVAVEVRHMQDMGVVYEPTRGADYLPAGGRV